MARLQHPSIVPIYEAARWADGKPFYSMKLVSGRSLKELIADAPMLDQRLALIPHAIAVAEAIAYAHSRRVIHRDIKPANVIVGPFGETVVIDWGLAKDLSVSEDMDRSAPHSPYRLLPSEGTVTGAIIGTPAYMAPEQAAGERVDESADIYALGALLYHLLCGTPPHSGPWDGILERVRAEPPMPLQKRLPEVPRDLAAIVDKAMARNPGERYASAADLALDLKRFQTGQLVSAHRYSRSTIVRRWIARNRIPVALSTAFLLMLAVVGVVSIRRIVRERDRVELRGNELILTEARGEIDRDPALALAWLKTYPPNGVDWKTARELAIESDSLMPARHIFRRQSIQTALAALSHDGKRMASAGNHGTLGVWEIASGKRVAALATAVSPASIYFLPDDSSIVFSDYFSTHIFVWKLGDPAARVLEDSRAMVNDLSISADGKLAAVAGGDSVVRLYDLDKGTFRRLGSHNGEVMALAFSRAGQLLASGSADHTVRLWNVSTGEVRVLAGHTDTVSTVALSPDGRRVASGSFDGTVRVWDVGTGAVSVLRGHDGRVESVEFSLDGHLLVSGGDDRTARVWDLEHGDVRVLRGHLDSIFSASFSPSASMVATGSRDGTLRIWQLRSGYSFVLRGHRSGVVAASFTPDSKYVVSCCEDKTTRVWDVPAEDTLALQGHRDQIQTVGFSRDDRMLGSVSRDRTLRVWDTASGRLLATVDRERLSHVVCFSSDGRYVAAGGLDSEVTLLDLRTGRVTRLVGHKGSVQGLQFSPDDRMLASAGEDGTVRFWDPVKGTQERVLGPIGMALRLVFDPRGRFIAAAGADGAVRVWPLDRVVEPRVLRGHSSAIIDLQVTSDGRELASASYDKSVRVWNTDDWQSRLWSGHSSALSAIAFSSDGRRIASGEFDGSVRIWEISTGQERTLMSHPGERITALAFSPDGRVLISGGYDRAVRFWDATSGALQGLRHYDGEVMDGALSFDGRLLAVATSSGALGLTTLSPRQEIPMSPEGILAWLRSRVTAVVGPAGVPGTE
jgi:WD40 repeat protein